MKYLGILLDQHLRWDRHISYVIKKLQKVIYTFKCLKEYLPERELKTLYYSLVESHLRYGISIWGAAARIHINPLEILQKRFIKIIMSKPRRYPTNDLYKISEIMDLRQLFYFNICLKYHYSNNKGPYPDHQYHT
ncbi:unnamed protein product, partial [Psylliodes chrysocephalus]